MCAFLLLYVPQFRSQRSSALCVLLEHYVMVFVLTLLYTQTLVWQLETHSWSWTEPAYVKILENLTSLFLNVCLSQIEEIRKLFSVMFSDALNFQNYLIKSTVFLKA